MVIIMNAFIANVIKPNVTSTGDETDTRGGYTVPTERLENGALSSASGNCFKKCLTCWFTSAYFYQLKINFSVANAELPSPTVTGKELLGCSE